VPIERARKPVKIGGLKSRAPVPDRMLVAQAMVEPMALITSDERLAAYPGTIQVV
jgi:PIN domain nuclease of toxin-antitoxin system